LLHRRHAAAGCPITRASRASLLLLLLLLHGSQCLTSPVPPPRRGSAAVQCLLSYQSCLMTAVATSHSVSVCLCVWSCAVRPVTVPCTALNQPPMSHHLATLLTDRRCRPARVIFTRYKYDSPIRKHLSSYLQKGWLLANSVASWRNSTASDLRSRGLAFDPRSGRYCSNNSGQVAHTHLPRGRQFSLPYGVVKLGYKKTRSNSVLREVVFVVLHAAFLLNTLCNVI